MKFHHSIKAVRGLDVNGNTVFRCSTSYRGYKAKTIGTYSDRMIDAVHEYLSLMNRNRPDGQYVFTGHAMMVDKKTDLYSIEFRENFKHPEK